jgi:cyanophycinase
MPTHDWNRAIGGSSVGATIQGDYLVRGAIAGPDIIMTLEKEHERGFNALPKTAIDRHINWKWLVSIASQVAC